MRRIRLGAALAALLAMGGPAVASEAGPIPAPADLPRIAVLPLENLSAEAAPRSEILALLRARLEQVELLIGYEGNAFSATGNLADDLLSITAVHPMREDAVQELLARAGAEMSVIRTLLEQGQLVETIYGGRKFYSRNLKGVSLHGHAEG